MRCGAMREWRIAARSDDPAAGDARHAGSATARRSRGPAEASPARFRRVAQGALTMILDPGLTPDEVREVQRLAREPRSAAGDPRMELAGFEPAAVLRARSRAGAAARAVRVSADRRFEVTRQPSLSPRKRSLSDPASRSGSDLTNEAARADRLSPSSMTPPIRRIVHR